MQMPFCQRFIPGLLDFPILIVICPTRLNLLWGKNDNVTSVHGHKSLTIFLIGVTGTYDCDHGRRLSTRNTMNLFQTLFSLFKPLLVYSSSSVIALIWPSVFWIAL